MKKTINFLFLSIVLFSNSAKSQFSIGGEIESEARSYGDEKTPINIVYNSDGFLIEVNVELDNISVNLFSKDGFNLKEECTEDGYMYTVCDSIIYIPKNENAFKIIIDELDSNWVKLKNGKWSFNNKETKYKSIAEIITKNNQKSIVINGTFYGKRNG